MKKLLAILVITLLAIPMFAGTDILNFMWFNQKIGGSIGDAYNPMTNAGQNDGVNDLNNQQATTDDARAVQFQYYGWIAQFMCGMWGTAYEGDNIAIKMDFFNYLAAEHSDYGGQIDGWANANRVTVTEQIRFKGIIDIAGIYSLALGAADIIQFRPFCDGATIDEAIQLRQHRIHLIFENSIKVLEYLNIGLNFYAEFAQLGGPLAWAENGLDAYDTTSHTNLDLDFILSLSGSYSFGFSWGLSQEIKIGLELEKYKDTHPYRAGQGGIIGNRLSTNFFRRVPLFQTNLNLSQEVLGLAGIENVTLTIMVAEMLQINKPWSHGRERTARIETEGKYGLQVGFFGFYVGLFMLVATQDWANTDAAKNDTGSDEDARAYYDNPDDWDNAYVEDQADANPWGRGQLGFQLAVGYSRGFFGFDFSYIGQGQVRDYDANRDNFYTIITAGQKTATIDNGGLFRNFVTHHRWMNQFDISINFSW